MMKPRKNEKRKSSLKVSPTSFKNKNEKLLARWTDGLFYFVKVIRVSEANKTCSVEFEDKSTAQVHFKDLLEAHDDGDDECHFCGDANPFPSNDMVTCSNCERVYHQHCHVPRVEDDEVNQKFVCRICVFASCAQTGGAKTTGHLAEKFAFMKKTFPYEPKCLTWDASHTSNVEQLFCYCGGPGCWYNKMLQCCRCKQWFHEACLQCLREQLLVGDHFYVFACSCCNQGKEFLHRMDMKWLDIVYVALFHLTMTMGSRYVDVEDVVTCVMNHSSSFKLKEVLNGHHGNWQAVHEQVLQALRKNNHIFICAAELRKKNTLYGIRERVPRAPHSYCLPGLGEKVTKESLQLAPSSSRRVNFSPSKCTSPVVYITNGIKKAPTSRPRVGESKMVKLKLVKSEHNYCTPLKCPEGRHRNCRSDSPSSTSSGSDSLVDLVLFDTNNNSPSKQVPPPRSPETPSPPPPDLGEPQTPVEQTEKRGEEDVEDSEAPVIHDVIQGRRSRSLSSSRESKHQKNGGVKTNGKHFPVPKLKAPLRQEDKREREEAPESDTDMEPSSPSESETNNGEKGAEKRFWSLDTAIPLPASFTGADHPFLTEFEQENLRQKRQHFEQELNRLASMLKVNSNDANSNELEDESLFPLSGAKDNALSACLPPPPGVKNVSGFRGELKSLIRTKPSSSAAKNLSLSCTNGGSSPSPNSGVNSLVSTSDNSYRLTDTSPGRLTPKSRRNLRGVASSTVDSTATDGKSCASTSSSAGPPETPPALPLFLNGVRISPMALSRLSPKNGLVLPSNGSPNTSSKSSTPPLPSGRAARHHRGTPDSVKLSPSSSRKAKEEEKAAQKRLTALQRCLKNLTPTCGFHFPVLEDSHPAVANSPDLSGLGSATSDSFNGTSGRMNGGHDSPVSPHRPGVGSASTSYAAQGNSPSSSPLQSKSVNDNRKAESAGKRGRKRKFEVEDSTDKSPLKKGKSALVGQENVRRSHRSRCVVNKFQAALDGHRFMASSSANSQAAYHNLADQYDVISLRVGWTGKVEYLIDWGH